jgi:hypothetical protein
MRSVRCTLVSTIAGLNHIAAGRIDLRRGAERELVMKNDLTITVAGRIKVNAARQLGIGRH